MSPRLSQAPQRLADECAALIAPTRCDLLGAAPFAPKACWIMVDITSLTEGLALFKSGMDGIRAAIGVARDIRGAIPEAQREDVTRALDQWNDSYRLPRHRSPRV